MHACHEVENYCKEFLFDLPDGSSRPYRIEDFVVDARDEVSHLSKDDIIDPL